MSKISRSMLGTAVAGVALTLATVTAATAAGGTITVPTDFVPSCPTPAPPVTTRWWAPACTSGPRATPAPTRSRKASRRATLLADAGELSLDYTSTTSGAGPASSWSSTSTTTAPATASWSASRRSTARTGGPRQPKQFVKDGAPSHTGGSGSADHGTLDKWRAAFPDAQVLAFGFSLGSGVKGDGVITSIDFAGTSYTFAQAVVLESSEQCKDGGWATSTSPEFKNQATASARSLPSAEPPSTGRDHDLGVVAHRKLHAVGDEAQLVGAVVRTRGGLDHRRIRDGHPRGGAAPR